MQDLQNQCTVHAMMRTAWRCGHPPQLVSIEVLSMVRVLLLSCATMLSALLHAGLTTWWGGALHPSGRRVGSQAGLLWTAPARAPAPSLPALGREPLPLLRAFQPAGECLWV